MWSKKEYQRVTVSILLLQLLAEEDKTGLQLVQQIREKTGGAYTAGLGSLFSVLHPLQKNGCITTYAKAKPASCAHFYHMEETGKSCLTNMLKEYHDMEFGLQRVLAHV